MDETKGQGAGAPINAPGLILFFYWATFLNSKARQLHSRKFQISGPSRTDLHAIYLATRIEGEFNLCLELKPRNLTGFKLMSRSPSQRSPASETISHHQIAVADFEVIHDFEFF